MKELFQPQYESFKTVNIEGFNDHGYAEAKSSKNLTGETNALKDMSSDYSNNIKEQNNNFFLLNSKVSSLDALRKQNVDTINTNQIEKIKKNKPGMKPSGDDILQQARKEDSDIFLLQQNYLYILGTITFAIVAVGAAVIAKN